jgi:hypothetical protein
VDFYDGSRLLGTAALVGGAASLSSSTITAGAPTTVTAIYRPTGTFVTSTGTLARTINKASATGTFLTLSPLQKQYSDRVLLEATMSVFAPGDTVTFMSGTTVLASAVPVVSGKASVSAPMLLAPGTRVVTAVFNSPNYTVTNVTKSASILKEDARVAYAGTNGETLALAGRAFIPITVNVMDISATTDPTTDPDAGDISTATVTFINRTTSASLATVTVTANVDRRTGTATYNLPAAAVGASPSSLTIGFIVSGNYNRNSTTDNVTITIKQ